MNFYFLNSMTNYYHFFSRVSLLEMNVYIVWLATINFLYIDYTHCSEFFFFRKNK